MELSAITCNRCALQFSSRALPASLLQFAAIDLTTEFGGVYLVCCRCALVRIAPHLL